MDTKVEGQDVSPNDAKPVLPAVPVPFAELTEEQQQPYVDIAVKVLGGLHCCTRVWEAWHVGTMTSSDFVEADFDDELVYDRAEMIYLFGHGR